MNRRTASRRTPFAFNLLHTLHTGACWGF